MGVSMAIAERLLFSLVLVLLLAPLFEGVMRKLKAVIQSRKGPPITQPFRDLLKLVGKEDLQPAGGAIFRWAPVVSLAAMLVVAALTPIGSRPPSSSSGDIITWVYVISLSAVALMLGAFASASPYAYTGASREMMMMLTVEPVMIAALLTASFNARTLLIGGIMDWQSIHGPTLSMAFAGIAFFLALQAGAGRLPFDIVEAETEIVGGPFIEYSGPRLALYKLAFYARQFVFSSILVAIFIPWPIIVLPWLAVVVGLAKVLVVMILVAVIDTVNPRLRIDQSMNYLSRALFVALAALVFAVIGV